jgi:plastocyanin
MSEQTKRRLLQLLILALVVGTLLFAVAAASKPSKREIVLVARDMAFYLPDGSTPNPTIQVSPGESIRLRLINEDRGMLHDWAVDAWGTTTGLIRGDGGSASVVFTAPDQTGDHEYVCSTHAVLMRGRVEVR